MITISNLSKNFNERILLNDVSLSIYPNEKIGLTGPNGAGKSTLFSIILGDMEPGGGVVQIQKNIRIGHIRQESHFQSDRTVIDELTEGDEMMLAFKKEMADLEAANKADTERYGEILHELEQSGYYELEHKAKKILAGLGFRQQDFNKPINHLSGGWQMRTLLAKLLTYKYDLLLLDEPTNYLDLDATIWFKNYLTSYRGTFVIISHDKVFLNDVTNYTIVLEFGRMTKVKGNYEQYEAMKEERLTSLEKQKKVQDKRRDQLERFVERFHAQPNKASQVRNKRKMIDRIEEIDIPVDRQSIKDFEFPQTRESGYMVVKLDNIYKSYGELKVYEDMNFEIVREQKICLVGRNGAGKSTLLKMLADVVKPDAGVRKLGYQVEMGYFSQTRLDVLQPDRTAFDEVASMCPSGIPALKIRTLLGIFNYRGDDVFKQVKVLSGGEKSRLILAKLLINPPNFILLDEPTTHLDIDGVEALTRALKQYQGTLCFISHDLFFIKEVANHIVEVDNGQLRNFPGGLDYYLYKKQEGESAAKEAQERERTQKNAKEREDREKTQKSNPAIEKIHQQHKAALARLSQIDNEIKNLHKEKSELETENYVKARVMSQPLKNRDEETLKEYGQRLKFIQNRVREIDSKVEQLKEEKTTITKS